MGRTITPKAQEALKWLKQRPEATYKAYHAVFPQGLNESYFSVFKSKARKEGWIPVVKAERTAPKPKTPELPESLKPSLKQPKPVSSRLDYRTDAGIILESAVRAWIFNNSSATTLRTFTSAMIREYQYIKQLTLKP